MVSWPITFGPVATYISARGPWKSIVITHSMTTKKPIKMKRNGQNTSIHFKVMPQRPRDFPVGPSIKHFHNLPDVSGWKWNPLANRPSEDIQFSNYSNLHFCNWKFPYFTYLLCCSTFSMLSFFRGLGHLWHLLGSCYNHPLSWSLFLEVPNT